MIIAHGTFNGTMRMSQGGKFEHGFFSGFVSSLGGSYIGTQSISAVRIAMSAAIGGTAEALGGDKFANGAVTGAYVMMFNHLSGYQGSRRDYENEHFEYLYIINEKNKGFWHIQGYLGIEEINGEFYVKVYIDTDKGDFAGWTITGNLKVIHDNKEIFQKISIGNAPKQGYVYETGRVPIGFAEIKLPSVKYFEIQLNVHVHKNRFFKGSSIVRIYGPTFFLIKE